MRAALHVINFKYEFPLQDFETGGKKASWRLKVKG